MSGLLVGILVAGLDSTIVATILPQIVGDLGGIELGAWVFASYMLFQIAAAPIFGRLCDRYGRRPVFLAGLAIFLAGSQGAAAAPSLGVLIACRAVQGVGAGALFPAAISAIFTQFPAASRGRLQALFSASYGISNLIGPPIGILLATKLSWRWAFHINIGIVAISAYLIARHMKDSVGRDAAPPLDLRGALLFVITAIAFSLAVLGLGGNLAEREALLAAAVAVLAFAAFVWSGRHTAEPMLPFELIRAKAQPLAVSFLTGAMMYSAIFALPLHARAALAEDAATGGLTLLPLTLSMVAGSITSGRRLDRHGVRSTALRAALCAIAGFVATTLASSSALALGAGALVLGFGTGGLLVSMVNAVQEGVVSHRSGVASSLAQFFRNTGGLVGVNTLAALHARIFAMRIDKSSALLPEGLTGQADAAKKLANLLFATDAKLPPEQLELLRHAYAFATRGVLCVGIGCAVLALLLIGRLGKARPAEARELAKLREV